MVGMVEIELDKLTGLVTILDYMAVVDCGIPINPALARIQTEGGIVQGIGHTLMENVTYDSHGRPAESSFMQYKVPTRLDMGTLKVEFEHSYEPTAPSVPNPSAKLSSIPPLPPLPTPLPGPPVSGTGSCPSPRRRWLCPRQSRNRKQPIPGTSHWCNDASHPGAHCLPALRAMG